MSESEWMQHFSLSPPFPWESQSHIWSCSVAAATACVLVLASYWVRKSSFFYLTEDIFGSEDIVIGSHSSVNCLRVKYLLCYGRSQFWLWLCQSPHKDWSTRTNVCVCSRRERDPAGLCSSPSPCLYPLASWTLPNIQERQFFVPDINTLWPLNTIHQVQCQPMDTHLIVKVARNWGTQSRLWIESFYCNMISWIKLPSVSAIVDFCQGKREWSVQVQL